MNPKISAAVATTLWGITYIVSTKLLPHNPFLIAAVRALGGALALLLLTALPFMLWFKAIASGGVVVVAPFILLVPITAFILDALITGFIPTILQIIGAIITIAGLLLSQWSPRGRANAPARN